MTPTLHIRLLGNFYLVYGDMSVTCIDQPRLQSLLAYLVLHRDAPQPRHSLAFLFWPDSTEGQARANLRNLLFVLRRSLPDADRFLHIDANVLQWQPNAQFTLDVADFETAVAQADRAEKTGDQVSAGNASKQAATLYQGDLLLSCYDDWILPERERLRQMFIGALERLIALLETKRDYRAAISYARRLLQHDPLHEVAHRRLMRLHALIGNRAAALRAYHACATALQRELGVEPSPPTREAYQRLLKLETMPAPARLVAISPLVGHDLVWAQLQEIWRAATAGQPHFVLLAGEAGIGKTRLVEELLEWAGRQGIATASALCYTAEGRLAYAPVVTWLRAGPLPPLDPPWLSEVARLLPELLIDRPNLDPPGPLTEAWQRQRLFEALARAVLEKGQPRLLLIDDLQWCDRETLEWLHYLLRFDSQARLLVVGTLRPEEVEPDHPLMSLLSQFRCDRQMTEIELGPLGEADTASLAANVAGRDFDRAQAAQLYRETEGNPLFIVESVRAGELSSEGLEPVIGEEETAFHPQPLPPRVQAVIDVRLQQLSTSTRELVDLAATIGRAFTFDVLAKASRGDEETLVRGLDELWRRRIVREQGADAYDFSHDKIREVAYATMSTARRRVLHCCVAEALEAVHAGNPASRTGQGLDTVSGQIATHYEQAGQPEQAIPYYHRAAEVARHVYANEEALRYYQRTLALLEVAPRMESRQEVAAQIHERHGDVLMHTDQLDDARAAYQDALALLRKRDRVWQSRLHRKSGNTWMAPQEYERLLQAYQRAENTLGQAPDESAPAWWGEWVEVQIGQMWVNYYLCQVREMAELAAIQDEGSLYEISDARCNLAFALLWRGELDQAEEQMQAALTMAERTGGLAGIQVVCLTYLTVICRKWGQVEEARRYALRTLAVAGPRIMYIAMAKANLAWVAWREGALSEAEEQSRVALELWQQVPIVYPFQWAALWPLIAVELAIDRVSEVIDHARLLLEPTQQPLPGALMAVLEDAFQAWEGKQPESAQAYLLQALDLAQELRYL